MTVTIESTVEALTAALKDALVPNAEPGRAETILRSAHLNDLDLAPYLYFESGRYTRNLIYRDEDFELLALCWDNGARTAIHDHGSSRCFMSVQRGTFVVEDFELREGSIESGRARLIATSSRTIVPGHVDVLTAVNDIHRVSAAGEPAVSLHVYARALDRCTVYDPDLSTCKTASNRYDTIRMFRNNRLSA